jgi:hypothetical protein
MLRNVIHKWEHKLSRTDNNRVVRPFEWGAEFLNHTGVAPDSSANGDSSELIFRFNEKAIAESDRFFAYDGVPHASMEGPWLTYPSPITTPFDENNTVHARYFPVLGRNSKPAVDRVRDVAKARGRAVVVLPHWNARIHEHVALCELLNRAGIAALRLSLPYHDRRMLPGFDRADYMVSANLGRTLQANRQAVIDTRAAVHWLEAQGYERIGLVGTSLGSCIGFLTFIHESRIKAAVFNHVSSYFGDVVWEGLTTAHVKQALQDELSKEQVRRAFLAISPNSYVPRLAGDSRRALLISARYDLSFTPELSALLFEECARHNVAFDRSIVRCGHYSLGRAPYKYYAGYKLLNYLRRHL